MGIVECVPPTNSRPIPVVDVPSHDVTRLLARWKEGDEAALQQLVPIVHEELRRLARRQMAGERPGHTLQPTALVNEAYLRLVNLKQMQWQDRAHFFAMGARLMRRIRRAPIAKKWARSCHCICLRLTSRRYASLTSAVG